MTHKVSLVDNKQYNLPQKYNTAIIYYLPLVYSHNIYANVMKW